MHDQPKAQKVRDILAYIVVYGASKITKLYSCVR